MVIVLKPQDSESLCHFINIKSGLRTDGKTVTVIERLEIITWKKTADHLFCFPEKGKQLFSSGSSVADGGGGAYVGSDVQLFQGDRIRTGFKLKQEGFD